MASLNFSEYLKNSWRNTGANKRRSFLTLLGIALGATATLVLYGLNLNFTSFTVNNLEKLGGNLITVVFPKNEIYSENFFNSSLKQLGPFLAGASPFAEFDYFLSSGEKILVRGVWPDYFKMQDFTIQGCLLGENQSTFCLLSRKSSWRAPPGFGVGETVKILGGLFKIGGIVSQKRPFFLNEQTIVYLPLKTVEMLTENTRTGYFLKIKEIKNVALVENILRRLWQDKFEPEIIAFAGLRETIFQFSRLSGFFILAVTIFAVFVGGVGIANVMLINVVEKKYEYGVRLAVGTSPRQILFQVLSESIWLSFLGILAGVLVGLFLDLAISLVLKLPFIFPVKAIAVIFLTGFIFGLLFGIYPAHQATQIDPAQAIRGG